jgi:hypothetical protein
MNRWFGLFCFALAVVSACAVASQAAGPSHSPQYTADGKLVLPADYREWIYMSSGLGMAYSTPAPGAAAEPIFTNTFVPPEAYHAFQATGKWPDRTMFALEERNSTTHGSIVKDGHYQVDLNATLVEVKDLKHFPQGWRFFSFPAGNDGTLAAQGRPIPDDAGCIACHTKNAAVEHTFVQFYPTLLAIAKKKGTLNDAYLKAEAAAAQSAPAATTAP